MMKVAIWGSYNYGNYGDDIMAIMFAKHLQKLNTQPMVYRLDNTLADKFNLQTTNSLDELFKSAAFGIIGGGGMLVADSFLRTMLSPVSRKFEQDFKQLTRYAAHYHCPIWPISIGGSGHTSHPLRSSRKIFFRSPWCQTPSVRLAEDIHIMKKLHRDAIYYPDVLLNAAQWFCISKKPVSDDQIRIGVNLNRKDSDGFEHKLIASVSNTPNITLYFFRTHLAQYHIHYEFLPEHTNEQIQIHQYTDPKSTLEFLSGLDVVLSSKLHLGLTALTTDVPFFSFNGKGKTKAFLKSIDASSSIYQSDQDEQLLYDLINIKNYDLSRQCDMQAFRQYQQDSNKHFTHLAAIVQQMATAQSYG